MFVVEIDILSCRREFAVGGTRLSQSLPPLSDQITRQQYYDFRFALLLRASSSFSSSSVHGCV